MTQRNVRIFRWLKLVWPKLDFLTALSSRLDIAVNLLSRATALSSKLLVPVVVKLLN